MNSTFQVGLSTMIAGLLSLTILVPRAAHPMTPPSTSGPVAPLKVPQLNDRAKAITQERINRERAEAERQAQLQPLEEAIVAVDETRAAVAALDSSDTAKANASLELAIGKLDVVLAKRPSLTLVPLIAEVNILDLNASEKTVRTMGAQIQALVAGRDYQAARHLMRNFASEINLTTTNLPMATFPAAVRTAVRLVSENKINSAKAELLAALNSFVISERSIPLPVVRAQVLIDEVSKQVGNKKVNKEDARHMLDLAGEQLLIAEELGYGTRGDFSDLQTEIRQVRNNIDGDKSILAKVTRELKLLKEKIF